VALALTSRRRALAGAASALAAFALAVAVVGRGCGSAAPGPESAVRNFVQAARAGDRNAVWQLLSPATQQVLEREAMQATDLVGSSTRYRALDLISIGSSDDVAAPSRFAVTSKTADRATVEVAGAAGLSAVELVRVNGRWRIDLPTYGGP
jgi:hypothetical protein